MRKYLWLTAGLAVALVALARGEGLVRAADPCDRWTVAIDGQDAGTCSNPAQPCRTVQYAINQADPGDRICVADRDVAGPTTYYELLTIDKTVYLDSRWETTCSPFAFDCKWTAAECDPSRVVLDASQQGRVVTILKDTAPTIDCFTITHGDAKGLGGDPGTTVENDAGGGIYGIGAAPIILNNVITANFGCNQCPAAYGRGGGIYLLKAPEAAVIRDNVIAGNVADESSWGQGGGLMLRSSYAQVAGNQIHDNRAGHSAGYGGGVAVVDGAPVLKGNRIEDNVAGQSVQGLGGGVFVWSAEGVTLDGNRVISNRAISGAGDMVFISSGGGIYYDGKEGAAPVIIDNVISENTASPILHLGHGGGMFLRGLTSSSTISGNLLESNIAAFNDGGRGGGLYLEASEVTLVDNDVRDNTASWSGAQGWGGGLFVSGGSVGLVDNVIVLNSGGRFPGPPASTAGYGGGLVLSGTVASLINNQILSNQATNSDAFSLGGGLFARLSTVEMVGNTLARNTVTPGDTGFGGGAYFQECRATLDRNVIMENQAAAGFDGRGGGVRFSSSPAFTMTNNIVAFNSATRWASGIGVALSHGQIVHNTIVRNTGGDGSGVHVMADSSAALYGNVIMDQLVGIWNMDVPTSTVTADYTLFEGNASDHSAGVVSTNEVAGPALLLTDFHLGAGSRAINAAPPLAWLDHDMDGEMRPAMGRSDVGADEVPVRGRVFLPVVVR